ncbi:c-type cytochrome [Psychrobacter sp. CAL346-MNA-CIBAN-0220]|uniref:c-type cytochrome n=1 Tax=Psychrobacter sp. CAL346-MNA-CIBAN-0220 TaxID=3140457 RepID=UPI003321AD7D
MTIKQAVMNKKPVNKWALSALGLSALLALSACSGGDNTPVEDADVSEAETTAVEINEPVVEAEVPAPADEVVASTEPAEMLPDDAAAIEVSSTAEPEVLAADAGAKLYEVQCKVCHQNGLLNAPKYGDTAAWSARITKGKETLYTHSSKGFNKMPPQANDKVSEAQVHAAVDYMLEAVS